MLLLLSRGVSAFTSTWLFEEGFEQGDRGTFGDTNDVQKRLRFVTETVDGMAPYEGKWCLEADLGRGSVNGYLQSSAFTTAAGGSRWARFMLYLTPDVEVNADAGRVRIFVLRASGDQIAAIYLRKYPDSDDLVLSLGGPDTDPWNDPRFVVPRGEWIPIEVHWDIDSGASDGTFEVYWNGNMASVQALSTGPAVAARFGVLEMTGRWSGHVYYDQVLLSTSRIYSYDVWSALEEAGYEELPVDAPESGLLTTSGFVFTGPGLVQQAMLIAESAEGARLKLYDTDVRFFSEHQKREELRVNPTAPVAFSNHRGIAFRKGCYAYLTGNAPQAIIRTSA